MEDVWYMRMTYDLMFWNQKQNKEFREYRLVSVEKRRSLNWSVPVDGEAQRGFVCMITLNQIVEILYGI